MVVQAVQKALKSGFSLHSVFVEPAVLIALSQAGASRIGGARAAVSCPRDYSTSARKNGIELRLRLNGR